MIDSMDQSANVSLIELKVGTGPSSRADDEPLRKICGILITNLLLGSVEENLHFERVSSDRHWEADVSNVYGVSRNHAVNELLQKPSLASPRHR